MKSGFVSIVGRPNVGKSTLLNNILNKKVAITSDKVGTTRNIIYGVYNEKDAQIVFIDTPGIGKAKDKLGTHLNKKAYSSFENDIVLFLLDAKTGFGKNDEKIIAIPFKDPTYNDYRSVHDLPSHLFDEMRHFFSVYKQLEGKQTAVDEIGDREKAVEIITRCINCYNEKYGDKK